jgi:alpha-glucosidase (family GH31 glycosyl hydrolase)
MSDTILHTPRTRVRVQGLAPGALRITHALPGEGAFPNDPAWLPDLLMDRTRDAAAAPSRASAAVVDGCLVLTRPDGRALVEEARPADLRRGVRLAFRLSPGEILYGWGEQFGAFARTSGTLRLHAFNTPSFLQQHRSYSAVPLFWSSRGYAMLLLNAWPTRWRIDRRRRELRIHAAGGSADYLVLLGDTPKEVLEPYTGLTGRPPLLPGWAFGLWGTQYPQEHQDRVLESVREHRRRDIPLDVVILDYHWEEAFHNFRWRRSLFPDPDRLIAQLRTLGVRLGLILTPFVNAENIGITKRILNLRLRNLPRGEEAADERALPEYEECRREGLLSHPRAWWWFGRGGMFDFTNPQSARWWAGKLAPLLRQGIAFFKNDDGEYLPDGAGSALGIPGKEHHNLYGFYYGKAIYEASAQDDRRPVIYARSVWAGSQRFPAVFLGDQTPTFGHMHATLRAGLNLGLAGFAYWTADVFGLDGRTTPETHMRFAQWAMFSPIARYFWRPAAIDPTRFPWSHGAQAEDNFRRLAHLRRRLLPYLNSLAWEAYLRGTPLLRPMMVEFPDEARFAAVDDQVMIGSALLLAPILRAGALQRGVILPRGAWHDFWSELSWAGGAAVDVPAPIDRVPLLVQGGAILPLLPAGAPYPESFGFQELELHLWPPFGASLVLREDDAQSLAYQRGQAAATSINVLEHEDGLNVQVSPPAGSFPGLPRHRRWTLVLHRTGPKPAAWREPAGGAGQIERLETEARITFAFPSAEGILLHVPGVPPGGTAHEDHPD